MLFGVEMSIILLFFPCHSSRISSSKMTILCTRLWLMPLLIGIHEGNKDQLLWHASTATKTVNRAKILFMQYFARLRIAVGLLELNDCLRDVFIFEKV